MHASVYVYVYTCICIECTFIYVYICVDICCRDCESQGEDHGLYRWWDPARIVGPRRKAKPGPAILAV